MQEIGLLRELCHFNLSGNLLATLPAELAVLTRLATLDLSDNALDAVPAPVTRLAALTVLNLAGKHTRRCASGRSRACASDPDHPTLRTPTSPPLPTRPRNPPHTGSTAGNKLRELPTDITALRNLTKLHLQRNAFQVLPPELGRLMSLKELDASFNDISEVPGKTISQMRFLTTLDLSSNRIRCATPPSSALRVAGRC